MKVTKAYKYRLYPNKEQKVLLARHFGACRFVFNYFLAKEIEHYKAHQEEIKAKKVKGYPGYYANAAELTKLKKEFTWLNDINAQSLQAALQNLDISYKYFFKKQHSFPRFKSKYDIKQSFKCTYEHISIKDSKLCIPKFQDGIKVKQERPIKGRVISAFISKNSVGQYFASIHCEQEIEVPKNKMQTVVGIDLGLKTFAVCSDKITYANPKILYQYTAKLRHWQRQLSRKQKGSKNRVKAKLKVARIHLKIANIRKDFLHKTSTEIVKNHDIICLEDLNVKGLMKNHKLAKSISDVAWTEFNRFVEYKSSWTGKIVSRVDRFFPSSKTCSCCGYINKDLTLADREWDCPQCHTHQDRDDNASVTVRDEGLRLLGLVFVQGCKEYSLKPVELLSRAMKQEVQTEGNNALC